MIQAPNMYYTQPTFPYQYMPPQGSSNNAVKIDIIGANAGGQTYPQTVPAAPYFYSQTPAPVYNYPQTPMYG